MEPTLIPDDYPSDEDRIATAKELLRLAERYLERGDPSRANRSLRVAEKIIAVLVDEPEVNWRLTPP